MANFFERSILLTIGAAIMARDAADSIAEELVKRGEVTTREGREALDEAVDKAKDEARTIRGKFDSSIQKGYRDAGIASREQLDEMELKLAQLEHRLTLLEEAREKETEEGEPARRTEKTAAGG